MALQLGALRDALLDAGAAHGLADKAAEELANYESRLSSIESRLLVLMWMAGGLYAIGAPVVWLLLRIAAKTGALA